MLEKHLQLRITARWRKPRNTKLRDLPSSAKSVLFNDDCISSDYIVSNERMTVNNELERM
jgi:hypothetical protein